MLYCWELYFTFRLVCHKRLQILFGGKEQCLEYEYLSSCSLDSPKDISKALWLISAFNQSGEDVEGFLNRLSVCYDSLELRQQFDFISLLKERKFDAKEVLLRKAFKSENNKLSLLAYSILNETGEGICNDRHYGLDWDNINTQIKEKTISMNCHNRN